MEELAAENDNLKREVKSLKETLSEANEERDQLNADLGTAINQIDDLDGTPASTIWKYTVYRRNQSKIWLNRLLHLEMHSMLRFDVMILTFATGGLRAGTQVNPSR